MGTLLCLSGAGGGEGTEEGNLDPSEARIPVSLKTGRGFRWGRLDLLLSRDSGLCSRSHQYCSPCRLPLGKSAGTTFFHEQEPRERGDSVERKKRGGGDGERGQGWSQKTVDSDQR